MVNTQVFGTCNSCSNQDTSTNRKIFQIYLFFQKTVCIFILEQRKIIFDCRFPPLPRNRDSFEYLFTAAPLQPLPFRGTTPVYCQSVVRCIRQ